ncbi:MAG: sulfur carrier protein ThiS [Pelagibacteraceae bacterium]|jgi:sulfur carrier protein|nr:thiamine biosynthesis protein ThiS [Candidatus Pelagibacter sp.]MAH54136.1 thiamine biosynthesis protein ThiS [Candidatus Pelagibacter sp.]MDP6680924.1 sulfur carrier protein ThiS [Pelagibacteraceae bacterium]MDP6709738.1 sulfur carrier protein ThiS [Pelagibacteraceae bacterium]|tara:strand:+ start:1359 stop:1577 length:219 start_codon:yes stop_codon:yes gene_type:complete
MNNLNVAKIQLNGSPYEISSETNLNQLLNELKIKKNKVAIEVNGEIVEKNKYPTVVLNKDDKVEIVHFIGGG